jgi:hypothetical protein
VGLPGRKVGVAVGSDVGTTEGAAVGITVDSEVGWRVTAGRGLAVGRNTRCEFIKNDKDTIVTVGSEVVL